MAKYNKQNEYWVDPDRGLPRYDFEEMYRDVDDPWGCSKAINSFENHLFLEAIFSGKSYKNILDIGCGIGDLSHAIYLRN